ncbi:hypothetical protein DM02DRAFT_426442 [Periconia macrospinosa]|uniref:Uncharacterized protein n=1 Tax=Periconia macrospinosa TaxID=97972 RepID=A0A2V1EBF5_9PLEO|nr:hypothetical protein DM02DRAFT_426442 [Periconia macrospinosa]
MCFCFPFTSSKPKNKRSSPPRNKKKRDRPPSSSLHGDGRRVVVDGGEKRSSVDRSKTRAPLASPYRDWEDYMYRQQTQQTQPYSQVHRSSADPSRNGVQHRRSLHVDVPDVWHRPVVPESTNISDEMLLNPRPHRSHHTRQKHASQKTLRGHGKRVKSNKTTAEKSGWRNPFAPSPDRTPRRRDHRHYQSIDSPPHTQHSHRHSSDRSHRDNPESSRSHQRQHRSRPRRDSSGRQPRSNTSARRDPDRRFAVLAATNTALEDLRREAFLPSPPPRRERLRRYGGVTIPAASIPYTWDCVSSQTSNGYGEPSSRSRRGR